MPCDVWPHDRRDQSGTALWRRVHAGQPTARSAGGCQDPLARSWLQKADPAVRQRRSPSLRAGIAAAPLPSGPTDQRRRLSDRRYVPLTPSRSGNAQRAGLRGYWSHCHRSLVGRSIDPACAPSTAPTGATGSRGTVLEQRAAEVADEAVGRGAHCVRVAATREAGAYGQETSRIRRLSSGNTLSHSARE